MNHVIIGVSAAGIMAATTIRELDPKAEIFMISQEEQVHSRCMLHKYLSGERSEQGISFIPENFFQEKDVTWLKNRRVTGLDTQEKRVLLMDGTSVSYDRLLIATGADSLIPTIPGFREANNVFGLRHFKDARDILQCSKQAKKLLVLGSGLVGMDAAYAFLEAGKEVTVVELADRILPKQLDEKAGEAYRKLFEAHGCRFILGKKVTGTVLQDSGAVSALVLEDETTVECDLIVVAAGVCPSLSCLAGSGVEADRFINVDLFLKTSCEDVYAAGDVTGIAAIWPCARKQGKTAACNMCGMKIPYEDRYGMKNTMNFYGLTTISLGDGIAKEGDQVLVREDRFGYKRAILRENRLESILIQGDLDYSGVYQYVIKNRIALDCVEGGVFGLSFADFYGTDEKGGYVWQAGL